MKIAPCRTGEIDLAAATRRACVHGVKSLRTRIRRCGGCLTRQSFLVSTELLLCLPACSNSATPSDDYVVEVYGSRTTFEAYSIGAEGLDPPEGQLLFAGKQFVRRFRAAKPLHELQGLGFELQTIKSGEVIDSLLIEPFVCFSWPAYAEKRSQGWSATETHEYMVTDTGRLIKDSNLQGDLYYTCELKAPDSADGEAISTVESTLAKCSEPERVRTQVQLIFDDPTWPASVFGDTCRAVFAYRESALVAQFTFVPTPNVEVYVQMTSCLELVDGGDSQANALNDATAVSTCFYGTLASWADLTGAQGDIGVHADEGSWTIAETGLDSGQIVADADMHFPAVNGWPSFSIQGHIDVPLLKVQGAK